MPALTRTLSPASFRQLVVGKQGPLLDARRTPFAQELFGGWGVDTVTLYRGAAVDGPLPARSPASFVSGTFSRTVATAHFDGGPTTQTAVLWRQAIPVTRLLKTFLETREMNERFHEPEAVLIADPRNGAF
jgi:hypothetical protein